MSEDTLFYLASVAAVVIASVATVATVAWKKRREEKAKRGDATESSVDTVNENASPRLLQHLSRHSSWADYGDDDEFFIQDHPKVELHIHLDGSFDPDFLWRFLTTHPESVYCLPATTNPPWEDPPKELKIRSMVQNCKTSRDFHALCTCRGYRSLKEMLNCFEVFLPLVRGNLQLIEQLAFDFCQRQWEQNVIYTEVRYSPHLLAEGIAEDAEQTSGSSKIPQVTAESVFDAVTKGLRRGCNKFSNITVNQILCGITWRPDWAMSVVEMAEKHRNDAPCAVVGVDIASGEEHFDSVNYPDLYSPHFEMAQAAKERGIPMTLHAGESTDNALHNVRRAVVDFGACRIGHGYRMVESAQVMKLVRDHNVHVEVCPTSSVETGGWVYDGQKKWEMHPATTMLQHDVALSLSSDDPAVFHTSLSWQYRIGLAKMGLTRETLVKTNLNAVEAAWCSEEEKERLKKIILCYARQKAVDGLGEVLKECRCHSDDHPRSWRRTKTDSFSDRVYIDAEESV